MPDFNKIPGGADTQIAQTSGNPKAVGLSFEQASQLGQNYDAMIARGSSDRPYQPPKPEGQPIPLGIPDPGQADAGVQPPAIPEQPQQPPEDPNMFEDRLIVMPTGEEMIVNVPKDMDAEEIRYMLIDKGYQGFEPDGSVWERASYGFQAGDNITTNVGSYMKSHFPFLATEILYEDGEFIVKDANDIYGDDFDRLSPEQRRQRMEEIDAQKLQEAHPNVHPKNLGIAGTVGGVAKAIADPAALTPIGTAAKAAKGLSVAQKALGASAAGAGWGGAYGASEVLATQGAPTTLAELKEATPKVVVPAGFGAVGGAVLGGAAAKVGERIATRGHRASLTPETAVEFSRKKYWPAFWKLQEQGMSSGEASSKLREKFNLSLDDEWRFRQSLVDVDEGIALRRQAMQEGKNAVPVKTSEDDLFNRQGTALYSPAESAADAAARMGDAKASHWGDPVLSSRRQQFFDDYLRPIGGVIKDISPRVHRRLVDMEGAILRKTKDYHTQFKPFMNGVRKMAKVASESDMKKMQAALANGNSAAARSIWLKYGMDKGAFDAMRQGLDRLGSEMRDAGIGEQYLNEYFPRIMKDYAGFRQHMGKAPRLMGLQKKLKKAAEKKGRELTDAESAAIIDRYFTPKKGRNMKTVASAKKRSVKEVTDDLLPFYETPANALEFHMREAVSKVERAKFFGKNMKMEKGVDDLDASIGGLLKDMRLDYALEQRLKRALSARFGMGEKTGSRVLSSMRQITGGVTLGNPLSAIRQLGDIPSIMKTQGVAHTLAGMFRKSHPDLNADVLGYMMEMAQELDLKGAGAKVKAMSQWMYHRGGFKYVDRYGKNTLIKAAQNKLNSIAKSPVKAAQFMKEYRGVYTDAEIRELLSDIAAGKMTDLVKSHINSQVMRIQPISRTQMPLKYLEHPDGRVFYQFRTWGLNQLELFRQDVIRGLKSPYKDDRRRAARQAVAWLAGVGLTNASITQMQKALTNRDPLTAEEFDDEVIWQMIGNFGLLNKYGVTKAMEKGDSTELLKTFLPPSFTIPGNIAFKIFQGITDDDPQKPLYREILQETGLGRIIDWVLLGGAEEYNERKAKERDKQYNYLKGNAYVQ